MTTAIVNSMPFEVGSLEAYLQSVKRIRLLSPEEEFALATRWQLDGNVDAARALVVAHLPLVVSISRRFLGYGLPHADLIQEGSIGLMKAVKKFNPDLGVRLASYAARWIKSEIHEFVIRNWRLVKAATTKATRKLFFNQRASNEQLAPLRETDIESLADEVCVTPRDVRLMNGYLYGRDVSISPPEPCDDEFRGTDPAWQLPSEISDPESGLESQQWEQLRKTMLRESLSRLASRERDIIESRWLRQPKTTLRELADRYGVTPERIRQIETTAFRRLARSILGEMSSPTK